MLAPVHVRCKALKKWNKENPDNQKTKKDIKAEEKEALKLSQKFEREMNCRIYFKSGGKNEK